MEEGKKNYGKQTKVNFGLNSCGWRASYRHRDARLCTRRTFSTRPVSALLLCETGLNEEFCRNRFQPLTDEATWRNTRARLSRGLSLLGGSATTGGRSMRSPSTCASWTGTSSPATGSER